MEPKVDSETEATIAKFVDKDHIPASAMEDEKSSLPSKPTPVTVTTTTSIGELSPNSACEKEVKEREDKVNSDVEEEEESSQKEEVVAEQEDEENDETSDKENQKEENDNSEEEDKVIIIVVVYIYFVRLKKS